MKTIWFGLIALGLAVHAPGAASCRAHSPAHRLALIELYTSEGCSSCPPADRFLSAMAAAGIGAHQAVPLSLHVDYWNYIGWRDPFSHAAFTRRQRWLSDLAGSRTIYTPEFFVGGKALRNWNEATRARIKQINQLPALADISLWLEAPDQAGMQIRVSARASGPGKLYVALFQNRVLSRVKAGENGGRDLHHDFVVRTWLRPADLNRHGQASISGVLPVPAGVAAIDLGVAAFVQSEQGVVLQALSMPACAG